MTVTESRSADRKKVRFPPPKAWDPEAKWTLDCVMFRVCGEKHPPGKWDAFKKLSPQLSLKEIDTRELCRLCYRHLRGRDCWSKDKVPNCGVDGCEAAHHHLLHVALVEDRIMVVQGIGAEKAQVFLCREDVSKTVNSKNIYFQFFGNNFNIDEWYYDNTCKPLTGGRNA